MKIYNEPPLNPVNKIQNNPVESSDTAVAADYIVSNLGSDRVDLSSNSTGIIKLKKTMQETPDLRSNKIEQLKEQISSGSYYVDGKAVASKMLQSWSDLNRK